MVNIEVSVLEGGGKGMSSGFMQPGAEGMSMPFVKRGIGKEICPGDGLRVYPVGWEDKMEVDPLPAGKGKRTMGN